MNRRAVTRVADAARAARTAGKAILGSGILVIMGFGGLLVPKVQFVRSVGLGGLLVVLFTLATILYFRKRKWF